MTSRKITSYQINRVSRITLWFALALTVAALLATTISAQTLTTLHTFAGAPDGNYPNGGLVLDASGNLYGTTWLGGTSTLCQNGCGTAFRLTPSGSETILHSFTNKYKKTSDGAYPNGSLLLDAQGNLYGTTYFGGAANKGTVFKLTPAGAEILLYSLQTTAIHRREIPRQRTRHGSARQPLWHN